jgi:ubiquitin carboxyl-terminal hydrolase 4/11/15
MQEVKPYWLLYFVLLSIKLELLHINSLFRHSDTKVAAKCGKTFSAAEDDMSDVYPLQLRLSVLRETNSLGVKVIKKVSLIYPCFG